MEEAIISVIKAITDDKTARGIYPNYATLNEVIAKVKDSMNTLYKQQKIVVGNTCNDKFIKLV